MAISASMLQTLFGQVAKWSSRATTCHNKWLLGHRFANAFQWNVNRACQSAKACGQQFVWQKKGHSKTWMFVELGLTVILVVGIVRYAIYRSFLFDRCCLKFALSTFARNLADRYGNALGQHISLRKRCPNPCCYIFWPFLLFDSGVLHVGSNFGHLKPSWGKSFLQPGLGG